MESRPTASIVVIGDEILKGKTQDTNSYFLCRELYRCGVEVPRVVVVPDDVAAIAAEVSALSSNHAFVLTTGGIGPTHDDVTYEGVAKAFGEELTLNREMLEATSRLCNSLGLDSSSVAKMSRLPRSAVVHAGSVVPVVSVRNVFVFPGIPCYLEQSFSNLKSVFCGAAVPYFHRDLFIGVNEFEISHVLSRAAEEYEARVKIGSYPDVENTHYQGKLTLEADSEGVLSEAEAFLRSHLPQNSVVGPHPPNSPQAIKRLEQFQGKKEALRNSLQVLEDCFVRYPLEAVCVSFNGGKDCTALLHLASLQLLRSQRNPSQRPLKALYVRGTQPFPETEEFIQFCVKRYNLELLSYDQPIKAALCRLQTEHPEIEAVLMGSRRSDPRCDRIEPFQPTDEGWPRFVRVSPLCDWGYADVWEVLRALDVPYCSLYDKGYTSLGCRNNTVPNDQLLAKTQRGGEAYYLPAYLLKDPHQEREGRNH